MNVEQLERIRMMIKNIRAELQTDPRGTCDISSCLGDLWGIVTRELKDEVWKQYLEAKGQ